MNYNEWRDELKSNLLCVSDEERRRVLDYYAEAYADRREAGFSEREIIDDFGAPYDAAQRILSENIYDEVKSERKETPPREETRNIYGQPPRGNAQDIGNTQNATPPPQPSPKRENYGWVFVILCIIFCVPLFIIIVTLASVTIGLCVAPFAIIISGGTEAIASIAVMAEGDIAYGLYMLGCGLLALGAGMILLPILLKLVKLMWELFKKIFNSIKNMFTGKEQRV